MNDDERAVETDSSDPDGTASGPRSMQLPASDALDGAPQPAAADDAGPSPEEDRVLARSFVAKEAVAIDTEGARKLERRLGTRGEQRLAEAVRKRRVEFDEARAVQILGAPDGTTAFELFQLAKSLQQYKQVGYARRLLLLACTDIEKRPDVRLDRAKVFQQAALCTYKDPDLPLDWKLDRAYAILGKSESLAQSRDPETLGIAGAIFKRKWEVDGHRHNLERSLFYYLKGYAQGAPPEARADVLAYLEQNPDAKMDALRDAGYTGINAAFILDVLAAQEEEEAARVEFATEAGAARRAHARAIRAEIARCVPALLENPNEAWRKYEWWFYSTVGEALFGLQRYTEALHWLIEKPKLAGLRVAFDLESSAGLHVPEWEYETTARQLAQLARLQFRGSRPAQAGSALSEADFEQTDAARAVGAFLGGEHSAALSAFRGRFGLGLSGGGFRASLFHIGVLARLAEIDALRHVEVLSCVSGGSIVGAHYYLEVRKLLQSKTDSEITRDDYIGIVKRLERDFVAGVQRNIRTRVLAELTTNLKMIFSAGYSRTLRVGELYERELFSKVEGDGGPLRTGPRWLPDALARRLGYRRQALLLSELRVYPLCIDGEGNARRQDGFNPRRDNWRRKNKVPVLVLNACSLNTGHNWQFTASYMGEPPQPIQAAIDCNFRLRRFYYSDAPQTADPITLGQAVAASSCVPGLFEPIVLEGVYPDDVQRQITVRLVDGGVCDNQGVATLLEQDCAVLLVSDGSGQMDAQDSPSRGVLGVPLRSNSILQARIREAQFEDISARRRSNLLRGLMFVHLKQELAGKALAWRGCPDHQKQADEYEHGFASEERKETTSYAVARELQAKLAGIRTDLDSFSDAEAYALMASGYRMTAVQFRGPEPCIEGFADPPLGDWAFRRIEASLLASGRDHSRLGVLLDSARSPTFKVWQLLLPLIVLKWALLAGVVGALIWVFATRWSQPLIPPSAVDWVRAHLTFSALGKGALSLLLVTALSVTANALLGRRRGKRLLSAIRWRDTARDIAYGVVMSLAGWVVARLHLHIFDPLYLRAGKIDRFSK
jgi:predicted acylesterase/phospholipase RssA